MQSQVFVLDILDDQLVVFGADALVTIYELNCLEGREFDCSYIIILNDSDLLKIRVEPHIEMCISNS